MSGLELPLHSTGYEHKSNTSYCLYKGMKLATATPEHNILFIVNDAPVPDICQSMPALNQINLAHLPVTEQAELTQLLLHAVC